MLQADSNALRGTALTADSAKWERLGDFFKPITDPKTGFRRPNHITAPVQRADGTCWTIGQSYEKAGNDDWKKIPDCKQRNDEHQIHSFVTGKIEY
ncbi:MAG: hypothetical protein ABIN89_24990 [Chitinophagaceae bacterium]